MKNAAGRKTVFAGAWPGLSSLRIRPWSEELRPAAEAATPGNGGTTGTHFARLECDAQRSDAAFDLRGISARRFLAISKVADLLTSRAPTFLEDGSRHQNRGAIDVNGCSKIPGDADDPGFDRMRRDAELFPARHQGKERFQGQTTECG